MKKERHPWEGEERTHNKLGGEENMGARARMVGCWKMDGWMELDSSFKASES